jgi:hypothetical protein
MEPRAHATANRPSGRTALGVAAALLALATWSPPSAQSLADVARVEAARRAALQAPAPTITDKDLPAVTPRAGATAPSPETARTAAAGEAGAAAQDAGTASAAAAPVEAPGGGAPGAASMAAPEKRDEAYWRTRFTETRQAVARAGEDAAAVRARLQLLDTEQESTRSAERRQEIAREREAVTAALRQLQTRVDNLAVEMAALEQLARNLDVPADWTR